MSTEETVRTFVAAAQERDPARRAALIAACIAENVRMLTPSRELRGRAAVAAGFDALYADPRGASVRLTSAIDAGVRSFRFRSQVEFADGTPPAEFQDAGEVDDDGRIALIITFPGPLRDAHE